MVSDFAFGPFVLSEATLRLTRDGTEVRLRPRAFAALRVLARHQGKLVDYPTLIAEAWEATHVSQHTVDVTISDVRKCLGEYGRWIVHRSRGGYALEVPGADPFVRQGWHFWGQRTQVGCERAIECFTRAIRESPSDVRALEGLSASYLALAIFGMRSPVEMHPQFLQVHRQAIALCGPRPELLCNHGFALAVFEHRAADAEAELLRVLEEKPGLAAACVRLSMVYGSQGRFDEALAVLDRGRRTDSLLPTLAATEILIQCWRRDFDAAITLGRHAIELHPHLQVVRVNYGQALQFAGRPDEAIAQYHVASILSPDVLWLRALEGTCQALLGRTRDARATLEGLEAVRSSQYVDAYYMSVFRSALGQPQEAIAELQRAVAENSAWLYALDVDPQFDTLRLAAGFNQARSVRRSRRGARRYTSRPEA